MSEIETKVIACPEGLEQVYDPCQIADRTAYAQEFTSVATKEKLADLSSPLRKAYLDHTVAGIVLSVSAQLEAINPSSELLRLEDSLPDNLPNGQTLADTLTLASAQDLVHEAEQRTDLYYRYLFLTTPRAQWAQIDSSRAKLFEESNVHKSDILKASMLHLLGEKGMWHCSNTDFLMYIGDYAKFILVGQDFKEYQWLTGLDRKLKEHEPRARLGRWAMGSRHKKL